MGEVFTTTVCPMIKRAWSVRGWKAWGNRRETRKNARENAGETQRKRRKTQGNAGFTLSEMLLCVAILGVVSSLIIQTLSLAIDHFQERTRESDTQILLNTLSLRVQDLLTSAKAVKTPSLIGDGENEVDSFFLSGESMENIACSFDDSSGKLMLKMEEEGGTEAYGTEAYSSLTEDSNYGKGGSLKAACSVRVYAEGDDADIHCDYFIVTLSIYANSARKASREFTVTPVMKLSIKE